MGKVRLPIVFFLTHGVRGPRSPAHRRVGWEELAVNFKMTTGHPVISLSQWKRLRSSLSHTTWQKGVKERERKDLIDLLTQIKTGQGTVPSRPASEGGAVPHGVVLTLRQETSRRCLEPDGLSWGSRITKPRLVLVCLSPSPCHGCSANPKPRSTQESKTPAVETPESCASGTPVCAWMLPDFYTSL